MPALMNPPLIPTPAGEKPPRLENGERLDRAEFLRRYDASPNLKAELIGGIVYIMSSPVSFDFHGEPLARIVTWLGTYCINREHLRYGTDSTTLLPGDAEHTPQPDAFLFRTDRDVRIGERTGYVNGAPDLICEVAASSANHDAHAKADAYAEAGVKEYLLWRTRERPEPRIDWYRLDGDRYDPIEPDADGVIESTLFPGLRLHRPALLAGDMKAVMSELNERS